MADDAPFQRFTELTHLVHREVVILVVLCTIAGGAIVMTRAAAADTRARRAMDADVLHERGRASLLAGDTTDAVATLRRAAAAKPDLWEYGSSVAEALVADGQRDAARQVLLVWRDRRPEDPEVNSQLARLAVRDDDIETAVRYYESALYGVWRPGDVDGRRRLRLELVDFLMTRREPGRALSQILALSANLPDTVPSHLEVADLFLEAGDPRRALDHFTRAAQLDPSNENARTGAGQAAFELADYARAHTLLATATDPKDVERREIADQVLRSDPLLPGLSLAERRRRLIENLTYSKSALDSCAERTGPETSQTASQLVSMANELTAMEPTLAIRRLRDSPETIDRGVQLAYEVLSLTGRACPPPGERDEALVRIAQRHGAGQP